MATNKDSKGHITRFSDSSMYDEKCTLCGATDAVWDNKLNERCPGPRQKKRSQCINPVDHHPKHFWEDK